MATEYNPLTAIRKIERDLTSDKFGSLSPDELYSLEGKVLDAHSQASEISNAQLYFLQLADERQQIKDTYRAKKEKLNTPEERDELLSQHRSALATNQYLMGVAKSVQGKSFSDILDGKYTSLKLKAKQSLALLSMLDAKVDQNVISDAKGQLRKLTYRGLDTDSRSSFENAIKYIKENGIAESNIKYKKALKDVSANIIERLNDIRATPTISCEDLEVSLVDLLDPEDNPYEYLKAVGEGLAAGEFAAFTPAQLRELEDKFKWAYFLLPDEDQSAAVREDYDQTLADFNDLKNDTAEAGIEDLLEDYFIYFIKSEGNPLDWEGYKPGRNAQAEITVEEQEIDVAELKEIIALENKDTAEYAVTDLLEALNPRERTEAPMPGKYPLYPLGRNRDDEKEYSLKALTRADERANVTAIQSWVPPTPLEEVVVKSVSKKSKIKSLFAQAAFIAGGVLAAFSGYQAIKITADAPMEHYHGTPAVEVVAPKAEAKSSAKLSEVKKVEPRTKNIEVPSTAIADAAKAPQKKPVKFAGDFYDGWTNSHDHAVLKGDTIVGLWNDAYQGNLAFDQYLKEIRSLNPQLENPDKIWPGQILSLPN